ncbi:hypothetical protein [Vagococcus sp.]|uniref:hypothetical protein n=1 Tax=Vagococcus sp. TaxID=1933889 RepID=UPI003F9E2352
MKKKNIKKRMLLCLFVSLSIAFGMQVNAEETLDAGKTEKQWENTIEAAQQRTLERLQSRSSKPRIKAHKARVSSSKSQVITFNEEPTAEILTGDYELGFDETNDQGFDTDDQNDRVRSFDRLFYTFSVNISSLDGKCQ